MTAIRALLILLLILTMWRPLPLQSQPATNTSSSGTVRKGFRRLTSQESESLRLQGIDPTHVLYNANDICFARPPTPDEAEWIRANGIDPEGFLVDLQNNSSQASEPAPPDLKNAKIWMDNFLGTTNIAISADVIAMKTESLKFNLLGKVYDYSGHYTVVLDKPREHKKPLFGFGSPVSASLVILEDFGGVSLPLQNVTIHEKSNGFLDLVANGKEWIYSGPYTIQK